MFRNHEKYFDKIIDFGDLNPPKAAVVEIKREVLKLIDILDVGIKNEIQNLKKEIKKGMENEFEVEGSLDLSFILVEKLDARIEKEIQKLRIEVKKEILQLSNKIKNKIQNLKLQNESGKGFEEEIVEENLDLCDLPLKNEIQDGLKPKIEIKFKRVKEDIEIQKGLEIIEKIDPPTKKPKLGQVLQNVDKSNTASVVDPQNVAKKVDQEIVQNPAPDPVLEIDQLLMGTGD